MTLTEQQVLSSIHSLIVVDTNGQENISA